MACGAVIPNAPELCAASASGAEPWGPWASEWGVVGALRDTFFFIEWSINLGTAFASLSVSIRGESDPGVTKKTRPLESRSCLV